MTEELIRPETAKKILQLTGGRSVLFVDTETTGLDAQRERVIELAWIHVSPMQPVEAHSAILCPDGGIELPQTITDITGITTEMVRGGKSPRQAFRELADLIEEWRPIVVGHNVPFDLGFLAHELARSSSLDRLHIADAWPVDFVCTRALSTFVFPNEKGHKLSDVTRRLGINLEGAHRAMNDLVATVEAFVRLWPMAVAARRPIMNAMVIWPGRDNGYKPERVLAYSMFAS